MEKQPGRKEACSEKAQEKMKKLLEGWVVGGSVLELGQRKDDITIRCG